MVKAFKKHVEYGRIVLSVKKSNPYALNGKYTPILIQNFDFVSFYIYRSFPCPGAFSR